MSAVIPNPACIPQDGGPQPPRLWSRATEDCINTGVLVPAVPAVYNCCDDNVGIWKNRVNSEVWSCVASDSTGVKLVAGVTGKNLFTSEDCGISWTELGGPGLTQVVSVACSADGQNVALLDPTLLELSTNRGIGWTQKTLTNMFGFAADIVCVAVTMNDSGSTIAVVAYDAVPIGGKGYFTYSADSGASWTSQELSGAGYKFTSISSNGDGSQFIFCAESGGLGPTFLGRVYIASSPGYIPNIVTGLGLIDWSSVASNASGSVLMACCLEAVAEIFVSTDYGTIWSKGGSPVATTRWSSVASNAAGDVLVAISDGQGIYSSSDFGITWTLFNPPLPDVVITNSLTQKCIASDSTGKKLVAVFNTTPGTAGDVWTYCNDITTPAIPAVMSTVTQQDLDMRRKAEILQYKKNNSNMSKKQLWARTIKGHGPNGNRTWATQSADGTYTNPNIDNLAKSGAFTLLCPGRPNNCAPTSNSDVPGKQMLLCMRPDVPLTNYIVNRTYLAGGTKWPQTAWKPGDKGFPVGKAGRNLIFK